MKGKPSEKTVGIVLVIYYVVGVAGLSIPATQGLFAALTPFSLLMSLIVLLFYHKSWKPLHVFAFFAIALLGYLAELAGVLTGLVFGEYWYGQTLGVKLFETPLMIGVNWLMLIYCVHTIFEKPDWPWWVKVPAGAFLMVAYDFIMEPVAVSLDMWSWGGAVIPLQNYVAWFVISLLFLGIMRLAVGKTYNGLAPWLFAVQSGFFLALNFVV